MFSDLSFQEKFRRYHNINMMDPKESTAIQNLQFLIVTGKKSVFQPIIKILLDNNHFCKQKFLPYLSHKKCNATLTWRDADSTSHELQLESICRFQCSHKPKEVFCTSHVLTLSKFHQLITSAGTLYVRLYTCARHPITSSENLIPIVQSFQKCFTSIFK